VIEEEPQHLPTEEDVDALLAATAATLLSDVPEVITFDTRVEEADMAPEPPPDWFVAVSQADAEAAHSESIGEPASEAVLDLDSTAELPFAAAAEEQVTGESVAPGIVFEETVIEETIVRDTILEDGVLEESAFEQTIVEATMVENASGVGAAREWIEPVGAIDAAAFAEALAAEHAGPGGSPVSPAPVSEAAAPDGVSLDTRPEAAARAGTDTATIGERRQSVSESMPESQRDYADAGSRREAPVSSHYQAPEPSRPAIVVPLGRARVAVAGGAEPTHPAIQRTLRIAAERGASAVHLSTQARPMLRVSGEFTVLEDEPVLAVADIERLVNDLAPPDRQAGGLSEWMSDLPDVGRVRCVPFRDHRGPGVILRMVPLRSISADQLGLSPEIRDLCAQTDGLVLVAGSRASGKSTLLNGLVDLINRSRSDYVITIESQIGFVHEPRRSVVSQREIGGETANATSAVRSALLEDPDVLALDDLQSPEIVALALEAVESGRLVFASVPASSSVAAVERVIELFPVAQRSAVQASLATALRAVIAQVLLRKASGGRTVAREVLLNTPAVSAIIQSGRTADLAAALDAGRGHGMLPLTESLAGLVREGTVHVAEAYRKALDRTALLAQLRRDGFDTSFAERLA
jgi:twitching motility protein PilT